MIITYELRKLPPLVPHVRDASSDAEERDQQEDDRGRFHDFSMRHA
jgi:hypothetical protein